MTVASQGLAMAQALPRLMVAGEAYFGRDMPKAVTLTGHILAEGSVEVGEPVLVGEGGNPAVSPENSGVPTRSPTSR